MMENNIFTIAKLVELLQLLPSDMQVVWSKEHPCWMSKEHTLDTLPMYVDATPEGSLYLHLGVQDNPVEEPRIKIVPASFSFIFEGINENDK